MSRLPLLISVPHSGLAIPPEIEVINTLNQVEIARDGDEGAAEIYAVLKDQVTHYLYPEIARAFVDLNRRADDFSKDGVVKTHTCWDVPIYCRELDFREIEDLLSRYYHPYHARLSSLACQEVLVALDCHTMADFGPTVGPDPGGKRPLVCLGDRNHSSCPKEWTLALADCLRRQFGDNISINEPFAGGFITARHSLEMPWLQLELSRDPVLSAQEKGNRVAQAIRQWCDWLAKR